MTVLTGHTVVGSTGRRRVTGLVVAPVDRDGRVGARRTLPCDAVGMSGGWTPAVHLFSQSRGTLRFDPALDAFVPGRSAQAERSAGAANGSYDLASCLDEGFKAGNEAAGGRSARSFRATPSWAGFQPVRLMPTDGTPPGSALSSTSSTTSLRETSTSPSGKASNRSST